MQSKRALFVDSVTIHRTERKAHRDGITALLGKHAALPDIDAELEKLAMDPRRSHTELAMLISRISLRISGGTVGRPPRQLLPAPERSEPDAVPFYDGLRLQNFRSV
jgi:hypothetical protein